MRREYFLEEFKKVKPPTFYVFGCVILFPRQPRARGGHMGVETPMHRVWGSAPVKHFWTLHLVGGPTFGFLHGFLT